MKKLIFTLLAIVVYITSNATVWTLNNNNPSPGQYSTYADLSTHLNNNDTVYVSGSTNDYGTIYPNKPLTFIGTGNNPDKQQPLVSHFFGIDPNCNGHLIIMGINVDFVEIYSDHVILTMVGCVINSAILAQTGAYNPRMFIYNNIFKVSSILGKVDPTAGIVSDTMSYFRNNIFYETSNRDIFRNINTCMITNNIFLGSGQDFHLCSNLTVKNNIFYKSDPGDDGSNDWSSNVGFYVRYNCTFPATNTFPDYTDFSYTHNIASDPLFVNPPPIADFVAYSDPWNYSYDFHLLANSPCITNLGDNGTERGLFGGPQVVDLFSGLSGPPGKFLSTGEPPIPQVRAMNVSSSNVKSGQSINVTVTSGSAH